MSQKLLIHKPWLDKLGLNAPTTTVELERVLIAFTEKDQVGSQSGALS